MKKTEQTVKKINLFNQGADTDTNEKILGATSNQKYIDARNMAVRGVNDKVLKFTGGESHVYGAADNSMECIGAWTVKDHVVEIFVNTSGTLTQFRIDGNIMLETDQLGFNANNPIQADTNDRCDGGELYTTDNLNPVYIFNIKDIIERYDIGDNTYFSGFNPTSYQAVLKTSPHHPVYIGLEELDGAGLIVGKYNYAIRYADDTGNKTSWSVQTPNIPVPMNDGLDSVQHVGIKTYGGGQGNLTNYGIRIKFRVDNVGGYQYIEIRRVSHNDGQPLGYIPTPEYMKLVYDANNTVVDILNSPQQVIEFIDSAELNNEWTELTDEEDTIAISGSFTAKTIRYYQNRLVPMNITYPSKNLDPYVDGMFIVKRGVIGFPVIEKLTDAVDRLGFQSMDNQVRFPHLQSGEKYGWGVYFMDDYGAKSFVAPIDDLAGHSLTDFQMPNRRIPLSPETLEYSVTKWKGAPIAATVYDPSVVAPQHVHEVFDLVDARGKTDFCSFKNILNKGNKSVAKVNTDLPYAICTPGVANAGYVHGEDLGHLPLTPTKDSDIYVDGHNYRINVGVKRVHDRGDGYPATEQNEHAYNPLGFAPNIYSHGMAIHGLKNIPPWARAFSIVRTKPAGRVVAQGIGFWKFRKDGVGATTKESNVFRFYSPDMDSGLTGVASMLNVTENMSAYTIQLVSPLGAFTEVYDGETKSWQITALDPVVEAHRNVDMAVYVRQLFEDGSINPTYDQSSVGHNGYVHHGKWVNSTPAAIWGTHNGESTFAIKNAQIVVDGRSTVLDITVNEQIYDGGGMNTAQFAARNPEIWGEPFYMINIIRNEVEVPYGNINPYIETGNIQKIDSRIGIGDGTNSQTFELVDERWEDCIPNPYNANVSDENRYIYVDNKAWWNVTHKSLGSINAKLAEMTANGYANIADIDVDGNPVQVKVYGVYKHSGVPGTDYEFNILFTYFNQGYPVNFFIPASGVNVSVKYDNRIPIKVFAGDAIVAENSFVPYDRESDANAEDVNGLWLHTGFPYQMYHVNERTFLVKRTTGTGWIQNDNTIDVKQIRQLLVNFIGESKVNIPLLYSTFDGNTLNSRYPHTHYVMRPHRWKQGSEDSPIDFLTANNMSFGGGTDYYDDYGLEWYNWNYGGFHVLGNTNVDYQKLLNDRSITSKPAVGFTERTTYCTRIIWSNKRSINEQDDPNLKSFPSNNIYDISDAYGEIKFAYDNDSQKGNNLFALTDHGTCLLITDKRILSDFSGNEIANLKTDSGFIQGEYWLSKEIGLNNEMWRGTAEYNNQLFIPNNNGVYLLSGLSLRDILRGDVPSEDGRGAPGYRTKLLPYLRGVLPGYSTPVCAVYDIENNEYLLHIGSVSIHSSQVSDIITRPTITSPKSFIFSNDGNKGFWSGESDYDFEKMVYVRRFLNSSEGRVFGVRGYLTFRLGVGTIINGLAAEKSVTFSVTPVIGQTFEFVDGTVNTATKPTSIEFAHTLATLAECIVPEDVLRDYTYAYYFMVPRMDEIPRNRLQNDCFIVRINHNDSSDFNIISVETGHKYIKW